MRIPWNELANAAQALKSISILIAHAAPFFPSSRSLASKLSISSLRHFGKSSLFGSFVVFILGIVKSPKMDPDL